MSRNILVYLSFTLFFAGLAGCVLFVQDPFAAANCVMPDTEDFGDAPDGLPTGYTAPGATTGAFPSRRANDGARTSLACNYWIGERVSGEDGYTDPQDPDPLAPNLRPPGTNVPNAQTDYDDGVGYFWRVAAQSTPDRLPAELIVQVQVNSLSRREVVFNVLVDANRDGDWDQDSLSTSPGGEWAVRNHPEGLSPGFVTYDMPPIRFPIENSGMPECMWIRVTITDQPINPQTEFGWSGTGLLGEGEIEDILVIGANGSTCTVLQPDN